MNLDRLPRWAQEYIHKIERERDVAIRELNEWVDSQTKSPFYIDEVVCTGETQGPSTKRRYVQAHSIAVDFGGVELRVLLRDSHGPERIELSWNSTDRIGKHVGFIPVSFQQAELRSQGNMRQ